MAGGGGGADSRQLDQTPTWAVASVVAVIILVSIALEKVIHRIGEWFTEKRKKALFEALEKVKAELMILGFISLLLTFFQSYIAKICIPERAADTMLPCRLKEVTEEKETGEKQHRRLLFNLLMDMHSSRRLLAEGGGGSPCPKGKVSLVSVNGIHQLHIFIFFLAVFHVVSSAITMALGRAKIRGWKEWERETSSVDYEFSNDPSRFRFAHETSFVKQHSSIWSRIPFFLYIGSFFRHIFRSVRKADYLTMRHGFISAHLAPGSKFDFQKYIKRSLEDDFKVVVSISPILWTAVVLFLLLNVHGWQTLFWVSIIPLLIILAVGTKLQAIITQMALEIKERHIVIQGIPLVRPADHHFWFESPGLVLFLIHFSLFQNAFQIIYFLWIWYQFGLKSCFHEKFKFIIARVCLGMGVQFLCSYVTLPLYALVSQMGSHMKRSVFDEQTSKALKKWRQAAKRRHDKPSTDSPSITLGVSPYASPSASPAHPLHRFKTTGHSANATSNSRRRYYSDLSHSDTEPDATSPSPKEQTHTEEQRKPEEDFSFVKPAPGSDLI